MSIHVKFTPAEAEAIRDALEGQDELSTEAASALEKIEGVIEQLNEKEDPDEVSD